MDSAAPIDLRASDALLEATRAVQSLAAVLAEQVTVLSWPRDASTPVLADWIARRHRATLAYLPDAEQVLEWFGATQRAAKAIKAAAARGMAEVYVPQACGRPVYESGADGRRVKVGQCTGVVVVKDASAGARAVCSLEPGHWVELEVWLKATRAARPHRRPARTSRLVTGRLEALRGG